MEQIGEDVLWPNQCCGVAFVARARCILGFPSISPPELARLVDTRVGPDDDNPWTLPIELDVERRGVRPAELERRWPGIFLDGPRFSFRHIPFNTIGHDLYWDVAAAALVSGLVVGLGFDYALLSNAETMPHVCRITELRPAAGDDYWISMADDYLDGLAFAVHSSCLERAVRDISGGFWLVGDASQMHLDLTLPWSASR